MATQTLNLESFSWEYDVFLSFRGDTRKNFTDHLYSALCQVGIRTFRDEDELRKGEYLAPELMKAIKSSRIAIIVLSENYASSTWCLDELVQVLECKEKTKQRIYPVFYNVDPSEVRKQSGKYGQGMTKHELRFGESKVQKWRDALNKIANMSGWDLQEVANGYESKFIDAIIEEVRLVISRVPMYIAKYVVGLESRIEDLVKFMSLELDNDVRMIGIYGLGGIGKTTLAKALYNKSYGYFECSCFLEISSEISEVKKLQEKLLSKLLNKKIEVGSKGEGIMLIKQWLQAKKSLIVLDNIEHINQFNALCGERNWFGIGSRLILTTREAHVLKYLKKEECYEAKKMNEKESLKLFSFHAFQDPTLPNEDYKELLDDIVAYCEGLPLALEVLGSYLLDKSKEEWIGALEKLKRIPHNDIQAKLRISYDGLPDNLTKALFLDLVCLPYGISNAIRKDVVISILKAMGYIPTIQIRDLVDKCLIYDYDSYIKIHSLLREMGREIVRLESSNPYERSRMWCPTDIHDMLMGNKATSKIEVIVPESPLKNGRYNTKAFTNMKNLRILQINHVHLDGNFKSQFKELKYLQWNHCPLKYVPSTFSFEKLVSLDMEGSSIKEFKVPLKYFRCLEYLDLSECKHLTRTPNFSGAQNLRRLTFLECSRLAKVHSSIGELEKLVDLTFYGCSKLKKLPNSLCKLRSLQELDARGCEKLKELPENLGNLTSLESLDLSETNIHSLPSNLFHLCSLQFIYLEECKNLKMLPELPPNLLAIRVDECKNLQMIQKLNPELRNIRLNGCENLKMLPELPPNLEMISLDGCMNLEMLPNLSNCMKLEWLGLKGCRKLKEIEGLEKLPSIHYIELIGVPLTHFSESIEALLIGSKSWKYTFTAAGVGNEIPSCVRCQEKGSSISFQWPLCNSEEQYALSFLGLVVLVVFEPTIPPRDCEGRFTVEIENDSEVILVYSHRGFLVMEETLWVHFFISDYLTKKGFSNIKVGDVIKVDAIESGVKKVGVLALYRDGNGFNKFVPITKVVNKHN